MTDHIVSFCILPQDHPRNIGIMFGESITDLTRRKNSNEEEQVVIETETSTILDDLMRIPGIEKVEVSAHSIFITRALLVDWNDLMNSILATAAATLSRRVGNDVLLRFVAPENLEKWVVGINEQKKCWLMRGTDSSGEPVTANIKHDGGMQ